MWTLANSKWIKQTEVKTAKTTLDKNKLSIVTTQVTLFPLFKWNKIKKQTKMVLKVFFVTE